MAEMGAFDRYCREVNKHPVLDREEEQRIAREFLETGDRELRDRLVVANLRYALKVAGHFHRAYHLPLEDLIQEANLGLLHAVSKFDPRRNIRLVSYASWWIRTYLNRYARDQGGAVRLPEHYAAAKGVRAVATRHFQEVSLDAPTTDRDGGTMMPSWLASPEPDAEEALGDDQIQRIIAADVGRAIRNLTPREKFIVEKRLLSDPAWTLKDLGEHLQISRERVRQIAARIEQQLQVALAPSDVGEAA